MNATINNSGAEYGRPGHLVRVVTQAGVELSGFHAPADSDAPLLLCLHGLSGGMDTSFVFDFLKHDALASSHILSITCSGHGNIAMSRAGEPLAYRLDGSAFERFQDCIPDLAAWVDYAARCTQGPIILLGHSLGASKVLHYLAQTADDRVKGLVLASAADLKGAFIALHGAERFKEFMSEARAMVQAGNGRALMRDECVIGLLKQRVSAQTLLDRFDEGQAADTFDFYDRGSAAAFQDLQRITTPLLAVYGSHGEIVGPEGVSAAIDQLRTHAQRAASFDSLVLDGNHWYIGSEHKLSEELARWLERRCTSVTT